MAPCPPRLHPLLRTLTQTHSSGRPLTAPSPQSFTEIRNRLREPFPPRAPGRAVRASSTGQCHWLGPTHSPSLPLGGYLPGGDCRSRPPAMAQQASRHPNRGDPRRSEGTRENTRGFGGIRGDVPRARTSHQPGRAARVSYRRVGSPGAATGAQRAGAESRRLSFPELLRACAERVCSKRSSIAGRRPPPSPRRAPAATSLRLNDGRPCAALPERLRRTKEPGSAARRRRRGVVRAP